MDYKLFKKKWILLSFFFSLILKNIDELECKQIF